MQPPPLRSALFPYTTLFRFMAVDEGTGWLYWGEVGPDATADVASRGPKGYDEWNQARGAGNFGWPYFVADNKDRKSTRLNSSHTVTSYAVFCLKKQNTTAPG